MAEKFEDVLSLAVEDIMAHGFDSQERVDRWLRRLREAARQSMVSPESMEQRLRDGLAAQYRKMVDGGGVLKFAPGVDRFTLERVKPSLRGELDRRIMASAELIKLNREAAIEKTLQRFQGWSTSIPRGGVSAETKREVKKNVRKSLGSLPFEERRVLIDQGHKLVSAISEIVATDGGAIAARWRSHWRQAGYNYRPDHKERDEQVYLVRDSWAHVAGLVKKGKPGYYDEITAPGQEPFCRCYVVWIFNLRDLPGDMLTAKGRDALATARARTDDVGGGAQARTDAAPAETVLEGLDEQTSAALSRARALDRLGFLSGIRTVRVVPDRDQWNAQYDDATDAVELQAKFLRKGFDDKVQTLLHEAGHRGQDTEPKTFGRFRRLNLDRMKNFIAMANPVHLEDFARRARVDGGLAAEVFAESYARAMLGSEMPAELRAFWLDLVARRRRLAAKTDARYSPVWSSLQSRCRRCSMFIPLGGANVGNACSAVAGEINAVGHCDLFEVGHRGDDARPGIGVEANRLRLERIARSIH